MNDTIYQFTVKNRTGGEVSLKDYAGKVLLIVNTATRCGFTPQYEGLEAMYERLQGRGFEPTASLDEVESAIMAELAGSVRR